LSDCIGVCTATDLDPNNCGTCGTICQNGQVCSSGQCGIEVVYRGGAVFLLSVRVATLDNSLPKKGQLR